MDHASSTPYSPSYHDSSGSPKTAVPRPAAGSEAMDIDTTTPIGIPTSPPSFAGSMMPHPVEGITSGLRDTSLSRSPAPALRSRITPGPSSSLPPPLPPPHSSLGMSNAKDSPEAETGSNHIPSQVLSDVQQSQPPVTRTLLRTVVPVATSSRGKSKIQHYYFPFPCSPII